MNYRALGFHLQDFWIRLRAMVRRGAVERELDDELRFHFNQQVEKFVQLGLSPGRSPPPGATRFGGPEQIKEECREARGTRLLETVFQDIRYGFRMLVLVGLLIGVIASVALTHLMSSLLFEISSSDPIPFAGAAVMLLLVALAACYLPARRAMRVEAISALRYE